MKIAVRKQVEKAIEDIFRERQSIKTLKQIHLLVLEKTKPCKISLSRLKKIILKRRDLEIKIKKREIKNRKIEKCPVCGENFEKIVGLDVFGRKRHKGYKCTSCNFKIGLFYAYPCKYIFRKKR